MPEADAFFEAYERPEDIAQADGFFTLEECYYDSEEQIQGDWIEDDFVHPGEIVASDHKTVAVESKNLKNFVNVTNLHTILENLLESKPRLSFVFCLDFLIGKVSSRLVDLCEMKRINIYFVEQMPQSSSVDRFEIKPYAPVLISLHADPVLDVILLSRMRINNHLNWPRKGRLG